MELIERAEHALAELKAGRITHWLHCEMQELVAEFHRLHKPVAEEPVSEPQKASIDIPSEEAP